MNELYLSIKGWCILHKIAHSFLMVSDPLYYLSVITGNSELCGHWHNLNPTSVLLQAEGSLLKGCAAGLGRQDLLTPCPAPAVEAPHTGHFLTQKTVSQPGASWHIIFLLRSFRWQNALNFGALLESALGQGNSSSHLFPFSHCFIPTSAFFPAAYNGQEVGRLTAGHLHNNNLHNT